MPKCKTDFAGLGGDSHYFRATGDARYYREMFEESSASPASRAARSRARWGRQGTVGSGDDLRIVDQFFLGPSLVRGFAPSGIGPRDISSYDTRANAIGGTTYFGGSLEVQFPIFGIPRELGLKGAVFADAGTLFGYKGPTRFDTQRQRHHRRLCPTALHAVGHRRAGMHRWCATARTIRSSVGASILWKSPLGPIRFDYAFALTKDEGVMTPAGHRVGGDQTQAFRFSGGIALLRMTRSGTARFALAFGVGRSWLKAAGFPGSETTQNGEGAPAAPSLFVHD